MKKFISKTILFLGFGILILSFKTFETSATTFFTDIDSSYAKDAIRELAEKGILTGDENGKFDPTGKIKRQDFAIILAKSLQLDTTNPPTTATFSDVPVNHYSFIYVETAVKAGLISGIEKGKFGTSTNLTREDMTTLFVRALGANTTGFGERLTFADNDDISSWARDAVGYAVETGLITGDESNRFNPQALAERQQAALASSKFLKQAESLGIIKATTPVNPPEREPEPTQRESAETKIKKVPEQFVIEDIVEETSTIIVVNGTTAENLLNSIMALDNSNQTYRYLRNNEQQTELTIIIDPETDQLWVISENGKNSHHYTFELSESVPDSPDEEPTEIDTPPTDEEVNPG